MVESDARRDPRSVSGIICGLPAALSVTASVPVRAPTTVGVNVTAIVQALLLPGLRGSQGKYLFERNHRKP